ncbi:hypothetical protein [Propionispora vibrioides]|nr:hypothetical protein [Propionispora vibrioides]
MFSHPLPGALPTLKAEIADGQNFASLPSSRFQVGEHLELLLMFIQF